MDPDERPGYVRRSITLRDEELPNGTRSALWAWIGPQGELHLDGQDLGDPALLPGGDGEYEYFRTIAAEDFPALLELLQGRPDDDVLALLARDYARQRSFELELKLRNAPFPVRLHVL